MGHFARVANRDNSSVLAGCYRELSSGMNEAGCRLYLRPRANSRDKAGKPQSGQMRMHVLCAEPCPKIIYLPCGDTPPRNTLRAAIRAVYQVIEVGRSTAIEDCRGGSFVSSPFDDEFEKRREKGGLKRPNGEGRWKKRWKRVDGGEHRIRAINDTRNFFPLASRHNAPA